MHTHLAALIAWVVGQLRVDFAEEAPWKAVWDRTVCCCRVSSEGHLGSLAEDSTEAADRAPKGNGRSLQGAVDSYSHEPSLHGEMHKHTQLEVTRRCKVGGLATSDQIWRSELDHVETRMEGSPVRKRIPL